MVASALYCVVDTDLRFARAVAIVSKSLATFVMSPVKVLSPGFAVSVRRYVAVAAKFLPALFKSALFCDFTAAFQPVTALLERVLAFTQAVTRLGLTAGAAAEVVVAVVGLAGGVELVVTGVDDGAEAALVEVVIGAVVLLLAALSDDPEQPVRATAPAIIRAAGAPTRRVRADFFIP